MSIKKELGSRNADHNRETAMYGIDIGFQEALAKLKAVKHSLRPAEKRIAEIILENPRRIINMSITDLAKMGQCSETTIIRMAQAVGYQGYRELKMAIATQLPQQSSFYEDLQPGDSLKDTAGNFFYHCIRSFNDTSNMLSMEEMEKAVEIVSTSHRVGCFGSGASGLVATDAQHKLLRVNINAWAFVDPHQQVSFANSLGVGDAVVAISYSGFTKDVLESVAIARGNLVKIIAIVGNPRSPLAQVADAVLTVSCTEAPLKSGSMITRLCQLAVVDLLTLGIAMNRKEEILEQLSRNQCLISRRSSKGTEVDKG